MQKYRICAGIVAAAAVVSMCACSSGMKSSKAELQTVMTVDGIEVPYEMYRYAVMMHLRDRSEFVLAERLPIKSRARSYPMPSKACPTAKRRR